MFPYPKAPKRPRWILVLLQKQTPKITVVWLGIFYYSLEFLQQVIHLQMLRITSNGYLKEAIYIVSMHYKNTCLLTGQDLYFTNVSFPINTI